MNGITQNVTVCVWFLSLKVFKNYPYFGMYQYFTPFNGRIMFHCMELYAISGYPFIR